jgi:hypothetical protein
MCLSLLLCCCLQFFPVEVYPVAAPVALAAGLFTYMLTRVIVSGEVLGTNSMLPCCLSVPVFVGPFCEGTGVLTGQFMAHPCSVSVQGQNPHLVHRTERQ